MATNAESKGVGEVRVPVEEVTTESGGAMFQAPVPTNEQRNGVTLEEIIGGTRCSPLTLKEFEGFLIHEERSVENLQFVVWYRSYCERFNALPPEYQALSEPPAERYAHFSTPAGSIRTAQSISEKDGWWEKLRGRARSISGRSVRSLEGNTAANANSSEYFSESAKIAQGNGDATIVEMNGIGEKPSETKASEDDDNLSLHSAIAPDTPNFAEASTFPTTNSIHNKNLERTQTGRFSDASSVNTEKAKQRFGLRFANMAPLMSIRSRKELPADTPLPFLEEIKLIRSTFFLPRASKELNIDARLRKHVLRSLQPVSEDGTKGEPITTHPEVFKEAADHVYTLMERSLPHYLQWAKGNTNTPKRLFWTGVGIFDMGLGVMFACIIIYFARSRWWRIFAFFFFWFGSMQTYSAIKYFCSQVHGRTARQLYPWELTEALSTGDDFAKPTVASTFVMASKKPDTDSAAAATDAAARAAKERADLEASLPFLFDEAESPVEKNASPSGKQTTEEKEGHTTTTRKRIAQFRSRFWATLKTEDGKRVPMFGPERVVEDPYIKDLHDKQMKEIIIFGTICTILFLIIIVAIPEKRPL
ncbi:BZ3500_MvSof-1268-A1-R1_Chr5-3g08165 [Microbotryum saponariae]|uniref:BZ3500_MvSof-1268-A1-R1_Chr5-3g08165 protein n=1 Tax=Microbotryum saponariae TaxID=289078 RepID=A0A2X0LLB1_9BASI|nr:BZ3500_MvSof-1268-A1-R1_Chr5-3g08165 [Microbotryum saponariae]SDA07924.1 BZ3501_MvSof-1269-A2-R1_Chr5-1g07309 [Microbotryum saponariae]